MSRLKVEYFGTNVGKIYLGDCTKRLALGGSKEGDYYGGQDRYIIWGETVVLELTDDVLFSMTQGSLKYFSTAASSTLFSGNNGAPLTLTEGSYTSADENPRKDLGDTGGTLYSDYYMSVLANDAAGATAAKGATGSWGCETGYFVGNSL